MPVPPQPKVYHLTHVKNLPSIVQDGRLWSDERVRTLGRPITKIGFGHLKERRVSTQELSSHPGLHVGACVPFYFSVRPPMLHVIHRQDDRLRYRGGQDPIVYLEADLHASVDWAMESGRRWAFTNANAVSSDFDDFASLDRLDEINWAAVFRRNWRPDVHHGKQAEFLMEWSFPWELVERVCVRLPQVREQVYDVIASAGHQPRVELAPGWYFQ